MDSITKKTKWNEDPSGFGKIKYTAFSDPNFGPTDNKNAIETYFQAILRPQKSMGGIVIDIWEKSNFFGPFGSLKGAKNAVFIQGVL